MYFHFLGFKGFACKVESFLSGCVIMAGDCAIDTEKYSLLEDFNVDVEVENKAFETFSLCFWVYLLDSTTYPSAIIRQVSSQKCPSVAFCVIIVFIYPCLVRLTCFANWGKRFKLCVASLIFFFLV